jgi:protein TonB
MRETTGVRQGTLPGTRMPVAAQAAAPPSKTGLWIGLAAVLVLALAGAGWFLFLRPGSGNQTADAGNPPPAVSNTTQPAAMPGTVPPGAASTAADPNAPAGLSPEEIQAQIQQMFEARQKEVDSRLESQQSQYDERIKELQKQLEESRRAAAEGNRPAPQEPVSAPAPAPAVTETRKPEPTPAPVEVKKPEPAPAQTAPAVPAPAPAQAEREEKPAPATSAPAPAPRQQPQVQVGDLVQPGPGVSAPKLTSKLDPRYPPAAQRMKRAAQVDIKVLVDEKGRVLDAERIGAKAGFGFDESALDAARRATFQPATKEGVRVKMWTTLRVNFKGM